MKKRNGFVSNSSSQSFIVSSEDYENVFDLAKNMLSAQIEEDLEEDYFQREFTEWELEYLEHLQSIIDRLVEREECGMNPDTPVVIPSCNFDTYIMKDGNHYCVETCTNHGWTYYISGIRYGDRYEMGYGIQDHFIYDPRRDIMMRTVLFSDDLSSDEKYCRNEVHKHGMRKIFLDNGELACPICDADKIKHFKLSQIFSYECTELEE